MRSLTKDLVELAVKVNEHTDIQWQLGVEYEERKKQLGTVISGISHDFRTPLTASLGYLQMIEKSGELSDKNAEYLGIVMQKNRYLKELSDEFFELTKIENSGEELNIEEISLSNVLTETVLEQHSWIAERNISTDYEIADGIVLKSDLHCLTRILNNLMSNAQKYTADSFGVTLKQDGGRVMLHRRYHHRQRRRDQKRQQSDDGRRNEGRPRQKPVVRREFDYPPPASDIDKPKE